MKRSEAVKIIAQVVSEYCDNWHPAGDLAVGEAVLSKLEKAGMLPPVRIEKSVLPGLPDFQTNKWEPEDEREDS